MGYPNVGLAIQGFQVSTDELQMDLNTFRTAYANSAGSVEYVYIASDSYLN